MILQILLLICFFNQKIGDFANNFKELFIDRGSKEENMFAKRSQEILLDSLDYFVIQFCELEFSDSNLRIAISDSLRLFPNLFSPLFKMHSTTLIMTKVANIWELISFPLSFENSEESEKRLNHIKMSFYEKKAKYICEYPIIIAIVLESQMKWPMFTHFYDTNELSNKLLPKAVKDLNKVSVCSEEILNLVKYNRNIIKLTNKLFWKQMDEEEVEALPLEGKAIRNSIISLETKFYATVKSFIETSSEELPEILTQGLLQ